MGELSWGKGAGSSRGALKNIAENLFIVILAFYPLRHAQLGLDLMDTGYNYANYTYMGTEHMDPMWLFSTWLSSAVGHLFTALPGGDTLVGMNVYTGLLVSLLALAGYLFCVRAWKIRPWIAFAGEMTAISLCWCPTALLYNYITYVLFFACFVLLYYGLVREEKWCLIGAGVCLGANVLARFSNLPEAAMILAVWCYDAFSALEEKAAAGRPGAVAGQTGAAAGQTGAAADWTGGAVAGRESLWKKLLRHTGWCLAGYLSALGALLGYIHVRYGIGEYAAGIRRLFAMTETATNYRAVDMVRNILQEYTDHFYWAARMGAVALGCTVLTMLLRAAAKAARAGRPGAEAACGVCCRGICIAAALAMTGWLYYRDPAGLRFAFCTLDFFDYSSIRRPGILFLMLTLSVAAIRFFSPKSGKEERLVSSMLALVIFLTSIGSNNRTLPSINNLFIAAPYTLQACWEFLAKCGNKKISHVTIPMFPAKYVLSTFLLICCVQFGGFGWCFVFAESTGVRDTSARVENNAVLKNVKMSAQKAQWMSSISEFVNENGLRGQEVILYGTSSEGSIPALSYYLQMPAAFNPWINLLSYSYEAMEEDMRQLGGETPVVILENVAALYAEESGGEPGADVGAEAADDEKAETERAEKIRRAASDEKLQLILNFMREQGYTRTFRNEKFALYQCGAD